MHIDEVEIDQDLVRRLIAGQFPDWASLPITPVKSSGTNNALFRLGNDLIIRLPRIPKAAGHIDRERTWLPVLAPHLSAQVPIPQGLGKPAHGFPWPWTVYSFLDGKNPTENALEQPDAVAHDLSRFIIELRKVPITNDAPKARRGKPLATQDEQVLQALKDLADTIDVKLAAKIWKQCLDQEEWSKDPVWVHGDLMPGNLLVKNGHLSGICDFEGVGVGDPACDLIPAWNLLTPESRQSFREQLNVDDATWERGKGWAFSMAVIQLPYYKDSNPVMAANARYTIASVMSEK